MKVSELTGSDLDTWVARAQGWTVATVFNSDWWQCPVYGSLLPVDEYHPSANWQQCGVLIEEFDIEVSLIGDDYGHFQKGTRPCISKDYPWFVSGDIKVDICRAVVASEYGEEVSDG